MVFEAAEESRDPVEGRFSPVAQPACVPKGIQRIGVIGLNLTTTSFCGPPVPASAEVPVPVGADDLVDLVAELLYERATAQDVGDVAFLKKRLEWPDEVRGRRHPASVTPAEEEHSSIAGQVLCMRRDDYPRPPQVVGWAPEHRGPEVSTVGRSFEAGCRREPAVLGDDALGRQATRQKGCFRH